MIKRVLVTGAQGFTGHYLVELLRQLGHEVYALQADIRDLEALTTEIKSVNPTHVVHLAGISFTLDGKDINIYQVHLIGSENLLKACMEIRGNLQKVILVSTSHVYGFGNGEPLDEDFPVAPRSHYAVSKYAMECIAENYRDDLSIIITRPFNYTGYGQAGRFLVPKLVSHFKERLPAIELGNIDVARDFSDVRWVAQVYRALLDSEYEGVVNLCSGRAVTIRYILDYLQQKTGHEIQLNQKIDLMRKECLLQVGNHTKLDNWVGIQPYPFESTLDWMLSGESA
jgi:nucleoside-diphosphate-sugar epimerase